MEELAVYPAFEHPNIVNPGIDQLLLGDTGGDAGVVTIVEQPAQIKPKQRLETAEVIIVHVPDDIGLIRGHHGTPVPTAPKLPEVCQDTRAHEMNQIRFEGFQFRPFTAMKDPVGENDGHFRVKRKGYGSELHNVLSARI